MSENIYNAVQTMTSKLYKKHRDGLKYEQMIIGMMSELDTLANRTLSADTNTQGSNTQGSNTQGSNTQGSNTQGVPWSPDFAHGGSMYMCFTAKILPLPESIVNGFGHQQRIDKNHFMMQVFRIPLREACNLGNLLRIACYTGILLSCMKADDFPEGVVRTFKALNMHSLDCYVDMERFTEATKDITKDDIARITQGLIRGNGS